MRGSYSFGSACPQPCTFPPADVFLLFFGFAPRDNPNDSGELKEMHELLP